MTTLRKHPHAHHDFFFVRIMAWLFSLIAFNIIFSTHTFDLYDADFCTPISATQKIMIEGSDRAAPKILGRDEASGCECKENPDKFTVCFDNKQCKSVPKGIKIITTAMILTSSIIKEIKSGDFAHLSHLNVLEVKGNVLLERLYGGAFLNMDNLTNLSISYNPNLKSLDKDSFRGLINLEELYLIKNGFADVLDVTIALSKNYLPKLFLASLKENKFTKMMKNAFQAMENSTIRILNLNLCGIEYLDPSVFSPLKKLEVLEIGANEFNTTVITNVVKKIVEEKIPLKTLHLFSAGFLKRPPKDLMLEISKSNISSLNLANNKFEVISLDSFPLMENLKILDLHNVDASNITDDAFDNLPNLNTLILRGNRLVTIPDGVVKLKNLNYLDLNSSSYLLLNEEKFINMKNLICLNLSFNSINVLHNSTFIGLDKLRRLELENAGIFYAANNSFSTLPKLQFLNLERNYFPQNNLNGIELDLFRGLANLKVLLLGGCSISFISKLGDPFRYLHKLEYLGLQENMLVTISPSDFRFLVNLKSIDLSVNSISPWNQKVFLKNSNLKHLNLRRNKISYLNEIMLEDFFNIRLIEMDENPFICDCASVNAIANLQYKNSTSILNHIFDQTNMCVFPDVYNNLTILEYFNNVRNKSINCELVDLTNILLILPLIIVVALIVIAALCSYYYRWDLRYWIFLARLYLSRNGRLHRSQNFKNKSYTNFEYDAFVSYSNEDRNFVIRLVSLLENCEPFLKLCVYERDFEIGTVISESVLESVAKSRKTLLIISDNYAKSQWCRWESQIAEHHRLFFENEDDEYVDDTLVLIKLGPVSENHLTPTLKYLLKTRIYLLWESEERKQRAFWNKLRNTLTPPKNYEYNYI